MKLKTISVVDALTESLRASVLDGARPAGASLTETDLALEYDVSRPTARAAVNALVQEGLLRREPHKPAHVPQLSGADIADLYLVRIPLELEVVRQLVMSRGLPPAAAEAADSLSALPEDAAHSRFVEADLGFHRLLVDAVDSPRLSRLYAEITGELHLLMVQTRYALGRERIVREHKGVYDAMAAKNTRLAQKLMREHLEGARDILAVNLNRPADSPPG